MQEYRLYVLDSAGALQLPHEFHATDDNSAIALADEHCAEGRRMELWQLKRKVRCWGFENCASSCERPAAN
jgi:hypothetical protein